MLWEELTAEEFKNSIKETKGVALLPIGCLEKHGYQLPLGTDMYIARDLAIAASLKEKALVVPTHPYGIISEAQHKSGCLSISSKLQYELLEELCDELARNGYHRILILNGHGGATNFLNYFAQSRLEKRHDYIVYVMNCHYKTSQQFSEFLKLYGPLNGSGHADMMETSEIMYTHPHTVHLERIVVEETKEITKQNYIEENGMLTGIWWYNKFPHHIAGDPSNATAEKGKYLMDLYASNIAKAIKVIKDDDLSYEHLMDFYNQREKPGI